MFFEAVVAELELKAEQLTNPVVTSSPIGFITQPHVRVIGSAGKFLEMVRQQLSQDFSEMRSVSSENLLYIKEDLIIPHVRGLARWRQIFPLCS